MVTNMAKMVTNMAKMATNMAIEKPRKP